MVVGAPTQQIALGRSLSGARLRLRVDGRGGVARPARGYSAGCVGMSLRGTRWSSLCCSVCEGFSRFSHHALAVLPRDSGPFVKHPGRTVQRVEMQAAGVGKVGRRR